MNLLIFDFEVFKYDTLFGCILINKDNLEIFQTWDLEEIKKFYEEKKDYIWIGHNNIGYDNLILEGIINNKNVYKLSQKIINSDFRPHIKIHLNNYDLMGKNNFYSLKTTEAVVGKNISESEVDFNIDRPLTKEEKLKTESYNRDDLQQTFENFVDKDNFGNFRIKMDFIKTFNLNYKALNYTGAKLSEIVLGAKRIEGIENQYVAPKIYDNLKIENKELIDFYLREGFRKNEKITIQIGNAEINIGSGGAHQAIKKYHTKKALYFDVSGYYNLTMINFDLLPRSLGEKGKDLYIDIYHKQLEYKKTDPKKREPLKIILLSVFGAMMSDYSQLYDPQRGSLVTITGQLFICDLLEKLKDKIKIVQTNTDGIIIEPNDWGEKEEIIKIVEDWEKRTGYNIKKDIIYDLYQRDVNNYMYRDDKGNIHVRGEALKQYEAGDRIFYEGKPNLDFKEPLIISKAIVEYFMNNKLPELVIEENKYNLRNFQYICKKKSYDYTEYELLDLKTNEITNKKLQGVNRVFALKDENLRGMIYKFKVKGDKISKAKISNLPDSVFVYDNEILSAESVEKIYPKINYQYYINRAYERILEFINIPKIKDIKL